MKKILVQCAAAFALGAGAACLPLRAQNAEPGFTSLFNGKTLDGWHLSGATGAGYYATNGMIACAKGGGGNLLTEKEFENFILRLDFRLEPGSNNGVGIRAPLEGDAAYVGMEIQMLEDSAPQYANLRPAQYHGSIYDVFPAKRGVLKKPGEWNSEEIRAEGRHITIIVNGQTVVDADLNTVTDPHTLEKHPGLLRSKGHVGFLGHNDYIEAKNIRIQELPPSKKGDNQPPEGFKALFNGNNLDGWKGLVSDPPHRAKMSPEELAAAQKKADEKMRAHWKAEDGVIVFDGKGDNLCTAQDYGNFEMMVDWKILDKGDSGIYLRGSPQVQIWEPHSPGQFNPVDGSGALYNNEKNPRHPLKFADKPVGDWNHFRIVMVGEKVHVFLNGEMVVNGTTMENYWERNKPIYPTGQIELQNHGNLLYFKNVYVRELK